MNTKSSKNVTDLVKVPVAARLIQDFVMRIIWRKRGQRFLVEKLYKKGISCGREVRERKTIFTRAYFDLHFHVPTQY
jgi:hypothetical protein